MNAREKAKEYAEGKSSASVFREQHKKDFIAGYNKAIEDSCADEMLGMLKDVLDCNNRGFYEHINFNEIEQLIKKITT